MDKERSVRTVICTVIVAGCAGCAAEPPSLDSPPVQSSEQRTADPVTEAFILRVGEGEFLQNGIVVKASPTTGTLGSILVEQTFPKSGSTILHFHEQGDELFYVVSGRGMATLGEQTEGIGPGDVIFVPRSAIHRIANLDNDEPLKVIFFMDSPELVEQFRAIHARVTSEPDRPITPEELAAIEDRIGGGRAVN